MLQAQPGTLKVKVNGLKEGDACVLGNYMGKNQYVKDTLWVNAKGEVYYEPGEGDDIPGGIFLFLLPDRNFFEFVWAEDEIVLETDVKDPIAGMKVKKSVENEAFFKYLKVVQVKQKEAEPLRKALEEAKDDEKKKEKITEELRAIDKAVSNQRDKIIDEYPQTFIAKTFRATREVNIPEPPKLEDGSIDSTFRYRYYRSHYWDEFDFTDERFIYTPILHNRLHEFMDRVIPQHPDSTVVGVKEIMKKVEDGGNKEMFRFSVITLSNKYSKDKRMCFDKAYVYMVLKYYADDRCWWVDSTQKVKIVDRGYKMQSNQCGLRGRNLQMKDINGQSKDLYSIKSPYTVLVFWAHDCGHCKKEMPQLAEFYEEYKAKGVRVFAVSTKEEKEPWEKFIKDHKLPDEWDHVYDPEHKTFFRVYYDVYSTPVIYLLDKDKKIIAKRIDIEGLKKFIDFEIEKTSE